MTGPAGRRLLALVAAGCSAACASDFASPITAVVVAYDPASATYRMAQDRIATLTSLRRLEGSAATFRAGGAARADDAAFLTRGASPAALRPQLFSTPADELSLSWSAIGGIIYPEDYASLELLSAYRNLEQVRARFTTWGLPALPGRAAPVRLEPSTVFAHADLNDAGSLFPLRSSELFYPPLGAWFLRAPLTRSQIPLHLNLGAVAHGLALQLWQQVVWGGAPVDPASRPASADTDVAAIVSRHVSASVAAGLGDFLGAAVANDPRWLSHSLEQEAEPRAIDLLRCSSGDMLQSLEVPDRQALYDPYRLGTVLAASLAETAGPAGLESLGPQALAAMTRVGEAQAAAGGSLTLAAALDAIVAAVDPGLRPALCGSFHNRFRGASIGPCDLPGCASVTELAPAEVCQAVERCR